MTGITTHVLDVSLGKPASGMTIELEVKNPKGKWKVLSKRKTDSDGRVRDFFPETAKLSRGAYRITFQTGEYFTKRKSKRFYPMVQVVFEIENPREHYHVPLLLSPFGYSTYRGS